MIKIIQLLILTFPLVFVTSTPAQFSFETLRANYVSGQLSYEQYLVYGVLNIFNPAQVPSRYRLTGAELPLKSGTFLIHEIKQAWGQISTENRRLLAPYLERPDLPLSILSPSKRFRIHYTITGPERVDPVDNNRNRIPDYVDLTAAYFDYSHAMIVDSLDYQPPAPDSSGLGKEFDIYIVSLSNTYGLTTLEEGVPGKVDAYSCYIEVDNDYQGFITKPLDALKVTTAHEYFHAVQVNYRFRDEDKFFLEMCSTWMEDVVYDQVNDYLLYLPSFFKNINYPFYYTNDLFEYSSCLWNHMLARKFGLDMIRKIWDNIPKQTAFNALKQVLFEYGTSFEQELIEFGLWNYLTGSRADIVHYYPEGDLYPEVSFDKSNEINETMVLIQDRMRKLSSNYFQITDNLHGYDIGLILTHLSEPAKDSLAEDQSNFQITVIPISDREQKDSTFCRRNNLVQLTPNIGIQFSSDAEQDYYARAVISDADNHREIIQFFPPFFIPEHEHRNFINNVYPNPLIIGHNEPLLITYVVSENKPGALFIYSAEGTVITKDEFNASSQNYRIFDWDGRNENGDPVSSGVYLVLLRVGKSIDLKKLAVIRK